MDLTIQTHDYFDGILAATIRSSTGVVAELRMLARDYSESDPDLDDGVYLLTLENEPTEMLLIRTDSLTRPTSMVVKKLDDSNSELLKLVRELAVATVSPYEPGSTAMVLDKLEKQGFRGLG